MKTFRFIVIAIMLSSIFSACKKEKVVTPAYSLEGSWAGKLGENKETPDLTFAFVNRSGNVIERIKASGQPGGTGSRSLTGNRFTASYTAVNGIKVHLKAELNVAEHKITGTWANTAGRRGTFYAVQQVN